MRKARVHGQVKGLNTTAQRQSLVRNMLSKTELEFLKAPQNFVADYRRALRHRIKSKVETIKSEIALLEAHGVSVTENCNGVTEFCNGQQNKQSLNQAALINRKWAEPDSDRRPLACKANVLTKLDDRPFCASVFLCSVRLRFSCMVLGFCTERFGWGFLCC